MKPRRAQTDDMFSGIDRVDSTLSDCINMAEDTLQHRDSKEQDKTTKPYGKPEKANLRLHRMGPHISGTNRSNSSKSSHNWTPEPTDFSDPLFGQDFDEFMECLGNLEPFDDLKDWSDNVDLFMEAMCHPPHMADIVWHEPKLKKQKQNSESHSDDHQQTKKNNPRHDRMGDPIPIPRTDRVVTTKSPQEPSESIFDKRCIEEPEGLTPIQSYRHL